MVELLRERNSYVRGVRLMNVLIRVELGKCLVLVLVIFYSTNLVLRRICTDSYVQVPHD